MGRKYWQAHREQHRAYMRAYREKHRDELNRRERERKARFRHEGKGPDRLTIVIDRGGFVWEREDIVRALRRWSRRHRGRTPRYEDLNEHQPRSEVVTPFRHLPRPVYPSASTVANAFGSFTAGLEAAGFELWQRKLTEACRKGHPYTPENTRIWRDQRICRTCHRERARGRRPAA